MKEHCGQQGRGRGADTGSIVIHLLARKPDGGPPHDLSLQAEDSVYVPGELVQVGEDPLRDVLYEIMVHIQGVNVGQSPDRLPGYLVQVVVAEVEVFQCGQEVVKGVWGYRVKLVVGQDQVPQVGQAFEMVVLVDNREHALSLSCVCGSCLLGAYTANLHLSD